MTDDISISLNDVVLDFPSSKTGPAFLKEIFTRRTGRKTKTNFYRAVDKISLNIKRGEVIGVIGPNGAGKSTLLRIIAGIYAPDSGSLKVSGRVSLLAGLGAGFQRNLTGRENISLSGSSFGGITVDNSLTLLSATRYGTLLFSIMYPDFLKALIWAVRLETP